MMVKRRPSKRLKRRPHIRGRKRPCTNRCLWAALSVATLKSQPVPDDITLLKSRHRLENHPLKKWPFWGSTAISPPRASRSVKGTMVDATIIHAPSSTKNKEEGRDPDRHRAQKGDPPRLGIKVPIGVDRKTYR